jgi:intein-encoded DNA endonuclease-like protein
MMPESYIPLGYCRCGCGRNTRIHKGKLSSYILRHCSAQERYDLTQNRKKIIDYYQNQGLSANQIANLFHCSKQPILNILNQNGIDTSYKNTIKEENQKNPKWFYIKGALDGDGHVGKGYVEISVCDLDFLNYYRRILKELCPHWKTRIYSRKVYGKNNRPQFTIRKGSVALVNSLKVIKPRSRQELMWYLRGMFDAEGSIVTTYTRKLKSIKKKYFSKHITLTQGDVKVLKQIKNYLKRFGIESKLQLNKKKRSCIIIKKNESIRKFKESIDFRIRRKRERLDFAISKINHSKMTAKEKDKIKSLYLITPLGAGRIAKLMKRDRAAIVYHIRKLPKIRKKCKYTLTIEEENTIKAIINM